MKKKLPASEIANELAGASAFFRKPEAPVVKTVSQKKLPSSISTSNTAQRSSPIENKQQIAYKKNRASNRPVSRPVDQSVDQPVNQQLTGKVVDRPVSFYLPEIVNEKIDEAVDYIGKKHRIKADRSAVVSAILGNPDIWKPEMLDQLVDGVVSQLTSRLTNRLTR